MTTLIHRIFLDLDGVIRNWVDGVFKLYNLEHKDFSTYEGVCDYAQAELGMSKSEFWKGQTNKEFWVGLEFYSWAEELLAVLPYEQTCLLTSPVLNCAGYNQQWIAKHLSSFMIDKKYLIGPAKQFCANTNSILIDDYDYNIDAFREAGGHGILFPQTWNSNRDYIENRMWYVKSELEKYQWGV